MYLYSIVFIKHCFIVCDYSLVLDTTRTKRIGEEDGHSFFFVTQEQMLKDIANNKFVEYGQHDGFYYGTKYDSIRDCIRDGKMCILDVSPPVSYIMLDISELHNT